MERLASLATLWGSLGLALAGCAQPRELRSTLGSGNATAGDAGALRFQEDMRRFGVGIDLVFRPAGALLGKGSGGLLAGRRFDLAQATWQAGVAPPVALYRCAEVPRK